jgi:hypothetical protein
VSKSRSFSRLREGDSAPSVLAPVKIRQRTMKKLQNKQAFAEIWNGRHVFNNSELKAKSEISFVWQGVC